MPTIGVALAIPEPWGAQLQDYRRSLGDATADLIPTHVTLIPPTEVAEDELAAVSAHLAAVATQHHGFRVHLRGTGTFRPVSPVVFVTVAEGIAETEQLAASLRRGPLEVDLSFPYHPHVTVAHHLDDDRLDRAFQELAAFECVFEVARFHLYVHDEGTGWRRTDDFALQRREG
ncbi:2'-5' RNA ligase family protein [Nocardioides sp. ChNu-153]|uniref:2'-5' RNA ligase family protein n=1 Tax=unclassified Nocardioides TaxID=2615069 RepID=UPI002405071B|nr:MULTISPECIES: 2'-5' RNA ligase family protein [unclassified Nocardioides]MDF9716806.1 2'-5' RNA ligase family protein [Nocardioides sp. ChNu-99]MDN7121364.1 2'-5' RNA ligase family protein [Nocardioides sp. ChNu-153]